MSKKKKKKPCKSQEKKKKPAYNGLTFRKRRWMCTSLWRNGMNCTVDI